jgi:hypothetical protein
VEEYLPAYLSCAIKDFKEANVSVIFLWLATVEYLCDIFTCLTGVSFTIKWGAVTPF